MDLRLAQPGAPGVSTMPGHYYSVMFDGSTRQDEAIAITVRFVNEQWEIIQCLVRIDIVAEFIAGTQSTIVGINGQPVQRSPASRKASIGHDHRWCSNKQSSSPQPGSPEAFMPQMIRWTRGVVYRQKAPFFGRTQHPLAGPYNLSFSHTHDQGHLCRPGCL